jgi:hypothetical protein
MRGAILHTLACLTAFATPWLPARTQPAASRFPGWPAALDGVPLQPLPLTGDEQALARDFPGRMAKFTDGRRHVILRFIDRDTRLFHPPAECMRNLGYAVHPRPTIVDDRQQRWGAFEATRGAQRLLVRERIYETSGAGGWTDVSSWYWAAVLGRSAGPWWSILVAEAAHAAS